MHVVFIVLGIFSSNVLFSKPPQVHSAPSTAARESTANGADLECILLKPFNGYSNVSGAKGLSILWSDEYVGLDLAKETFDNDKSIKKTKTTLAVIDSNSKKASESTSHGQKVCSIIERNTPINCFSCENSTLNTFSSEQMSYFNCDTGGGTWGSKIQTYLKTSNAKVFNLSIAGFLKEPRMKERLEAYIKSHNALFAHSSGNDFPYYETENDNFSNFINVGSLRHDGLMASYSSAFLNVDIAAPSHDHITAVDPSHPFGGTSGAAPIVASSLLMLVNILPEIDISMAKELVKLTALPSWNTFENPQFDGAGTLNAFGLNDIAAKIKKACGNSLQPTDECYQNTVRQYKIDRTTINAELLKEVNLAFSCRDEVKERSNNLFSCQDKQKLLRALRIAAYLSPDVSPYWKSLACIHRRIGFPMNATFYDSLAVQDFPPSNITATRSKITKLIGSLVDAREQGEDRKRFEFQKMLTQESINPQKYTYSKDGSYGAYFKFSAAQEQEKLKDIFENSTNVDEQRGSLLGLHVTLGDKALPYFQKALLSEKLELRNTAIWALFDIPTGSNLLAIALSEKDKDTKLTEIIARHLSKNTTTQKTLESYFASEDPLLRRNAIWSFNCKEIGNLERFASALKDKDLRVKIAAMDQIKTAGLFNQNMLDKSLHYLVPMLSDENETIRQEAQEALSYFLYNRNDVAVRVLNSTEINNTNKAYIEFLLKLKAKN